MRIIAQINGEKGTVTLVPNWVARLFGAKIRRGDVGRTANAASPYAGGQSQRKVWYWVATERIVGDKVERAIETTEVADLPQAKVKP